MRKFIILILLNFVIISIPAQELTYKCSRQECYTIKNDSITSGPVYTQELKFNFSRTFIEIEPDSILKKIQVDYNIENYNYYSIIDVYETNERNLKIIGKRNYIYIAEDNYLIKYYYNTGKTTTTDGVFKDLYVPYDEEKHSMTGCTVYVFESNIEQAIRPLYIK